MIFTIYNGDKKDSEELPRPGHQEILQTPVSSSEALKAGQSTKPIRLRFSMAGAGITDHCGRPLELKTTREQRVTPPSRNSEATGKTTTKGCE